jgi:hypothetical protein
VKLNTSPAQGRRAKQCVCIDYRSKHIKIRYHFIGECVERGDVVLEFVGTQDQLADMLTKALGRVRFQELREKIGVVKIMPPKSMK